MAAMSPPFVIVRAIGRLALDPAGDSAPMPVAYTTGGLDAAMRRMPNGRCSARWVAPADRADALAFLELSVTGDGVAVVAA